MFLLYDTIYQFIFVLCAFRHCLKINMELKINGCTFSANGSRHPALNLNDFRNKSENFQYKQLLEWFSLQRMQF